MRSKSFVGLALLGWLGAGLAFGADQYNIDPVHSSLEFSVKHLMISNVKGNFKEFSGTIVYDEKDITKSSVRVAIKAASINTENDKRDAHLRSAEFFDVEKYPELTFESKQIKKSGNGYVAVGTLTMHGVSKEVSLPFTLAGPMKDPWGNSRMAAESGLEVNRLDYGVSWNKTLDTGGVMVSDKVKIDLAVEAVKQEAPQK